MLCWHRMATNHSIGDGGVVDEKIFLGTGRETRARTVDDSTNDLVNFASGTGLSARISGRESSQGIVASGLSCGRKDCGGRSCEGRPSEGPGNAANRWNWSQ